MNTGRFGDTADIKVPKATSIRPDIKGSFQPFRSRIIVVIKIAEHVRSVSADCGRPAAVLSDIKESGFISSLAIVGMKAEDSLDAK
jgi:hypothetical protein